jgi:hypothetical protein
LASADGLCATEPRFTPSPSIGLDVIYSEARGVAIADDAFVPLSWATCRDPLRISRTAFAQPTAAACMRQMIADDPRALLPACGESFGYSFSGRRCADDGRYLGAALPPNGVEADVRTFFRRYVEFDLDDAGISFAEAAAVEADAWAHSDDGGTVPSGDFGQLQRWNGVNPATCVFLPDGGVENVLDGGLGDAGAPDAGEPDAGLLDAGQLDAGEVDAGVGVEEPLPPVTSCGCSGGAGSLISLTLLLLVARRRRD